MKAGTAGAVIALALTATPAQGAERLVVRFASDVDATERSAIRREADVRLHRAARGLAGTQVVTSEDERAATAALRRLKADHDVVWAERDVRVKANALPNDPRYPDVWGLPAIGAPAAWDTTTGSSAVKVAVVDTGIAALHPDLSPNLWSNPGESGAGRESNGRDDDANGVVDDVSGYDFVALDPVPQDLNGHGTHVAGTLGARGNDGYGVPGVAWSAQIMPLRALSEEGDGWGVDVAQAIAYAARQGAQVANLSLGGRFSHAIDDAIRGNPDLLVVASAGNAGADVDGAAEAFPCELPYANVLCVTAVDRNTQLPGFANVGAKGVDLAAPGTDVLSTMPPQETVFDDDFETPTEGRWANIHNWGRSTAQASSPTHSYAATFGPTGVLSAPQVARSPEFDIRAYGHCRVSITAWLNPATPGDRLVLQPRGLAPGLELTGADGPIVARRARIDIDKRLIGGLQFDLELYTGRDGAPTQGAIDDMLLRCIDREGGAQDAEFDRFNGTSRAAPFVSGAAALLYTREPTATVASVRAALLDSVTPAPALSGKTVSGGVVHVDRALDRPLVARTPVTPPPPFSGTPLPISDGTPGAMDTSYGSGGFVRTSWPHADGLQTANTGHRVARLAGGGLIAVGSDYDKLLVTRLNGDGSLDSAFGDRGRYVTSLAVEYPSLTTLNLGGVAVLPDGKIQVSLTRRLNNDETPVLVRLLPDGARDPSFGDNGVVVPPLGPRSWLWEVVPDAQGRFYSVFRTGHFTDGIVRFLPNGSIDRSFGDNGVHAYTMTDPDNDNIWTGGVGFSNIHLVPGGKLVTSGCSMGQGSEGVVTTLRLLESGQLDPTYGKGGRADSFPFGPTGFCEGQSALAADGGLMIFGGAFRSTTPITPFVARFRPDGQVDQSFGLNGIRYLPHSVQNSFATNGSALSDGRFQILVADQTTASWSIRRLLRDGRLDEGYGKCGIATVPLPPENTNDGFNHMFADADGRTTLVGSDGSALLLARLTGGRLAETPTTCGDQPGGDPPGDGEDPPGGDPPPEDPPGSDPPGDGEDPPGEDLPDRDPTDQGAVMPTAPPWPPAPPATGTTSASAVRPATPARPKPLTARFVRGRLHVRVHCPGAARRPCRRLLHVRWTRRGKAIGAVIRVRRTVRQGVTLDLRFSASPPRLATGVTVSLLDGTSRKRLARTTASRPGGLR